MSKQNKKVKIQKIKVQIVVLLCCFHQKIVIMVYVCNVQGSLVGSPDKIESESMLEDIHHPINMEILLMIQNGKVDETFVNKMYLGVKDIINNSGYQGISCKELISKESNDPNQITN